MGGLHFMLVGPIDVFKLRHCKKIGTKARQGCKAAPGTALAAAPWIVLKGPALYGRVQRYIEGQWSKLACSFEI